MCESVQQKLGHTTLFDRIFLIDIVIGSFCQIWTNVSHSDFMNRPRKGQIFIFTMNRFKWFLHIQIKYTCAIKDWPAKKVTIYFPIFYWVKTSENTLFFSLHFTWLYDSWNHQRVLEKWPFCKYDSWFSSLVSKLTSVFYPWNNAFSGMEKIDFHKYFPVIVIDLTKCSLL